jgi:hypothetical protein
LPNLFAVSVAENYLFFLMITAKLLYGKTSDDRLLSLYTKNLKLIT